MAVALSCLLPAAGHAADDRARIAAAADRAFKPLLAQHDVPGIAVGVTVNGQQHFFSYGVASRESKVPVTKDTLFEIGSISKTFAATLAAYAQAQGALSLDDHPGKYMPQLQGGAIDKATLLHLATYTAGGLPLHFPPGVANDAQMTAYFRQWKPSAEPGAQRRYSNPSIGLFGHVAALAMKRDFAGIMEGEIFPKLRLGNSFIDVPAARMRDAATGYNRANRPVRMNPGMLGAAAYGVKTSAADMIRYVEMQIRPDASDPAMRRAVEATHVGYFRIGDMVQGLGWEQYAYPVPLERLLAGNSEKMSMQPNAATKLAPRRPSEPTLFNKTGSTSGFGAYAAFVPARRIGILMLANRNFPNAARIAAAHAVLQELAGL